MSGPKHAQHCKEIKQYPLFVYIIFNSYSTNSSRIWADSVEVSSTESAIAVVNVLGETSACWPQNWAQFFYHSNSKHIYIGLCVAFVAKKGWQNTQNKIFCDRKTLSRHLGFSTSRIWANILLVEEPVRLQNTWYPLAALISSIYRSYKKEESIRSFFIEICCLGSYLYNLEKKVGKFETGTVSTKKLK